MQTEMKAAKPAVTKPKTISGVTKAPTTAKNHRAEQSVIPAPADVARPNPATQPVNGMAPIAAEALKASSGAEPQQLDACPAPAVAWSDEDEQGFQTILARRKAAGFQRRGRDVGQQVLCPGKITPNAGTVVATIVGLVAARGTVNRGDLLDAMGHTAFPHAKARPGDRNWCQGYVAGALRDGFLAIAGEPSPSEKPAEGSR